MAPSQQPKTEAFDVCDLASSSPAVVIKAVGSIVPITLIHSIKYLGNSSYQAIMKVKHSLQDVLEIGRLKFGEVSLLVNPVGPQLTQVSCLSLTGIVTGETVVQGLDPYGKVNSLNQSVPACRQEAVYTVASSCRSSLRLILYCAWMAENNRKGSGATALFGNS